MSKIRKAAKGRECLVRLPGCDGGGETTVLAHYRISGYCGAGMKPDDSSFGAFCCWQCHQYCDFRETLAGYTREEIRLAHAEGVMRTFDALRKEGLL